MPATNTTSQATRTVRRRRTTTRASFARRPDLRGTACGDGIGCWAVVAIVLVIERSLTSVVPATVWTAGLASHRENRQVRLRHRPTSPDQLRARVTLPGGAVRSLSRGR